MREDFHFTHRMNPDLMYHAKLINGSYKVSWTDDRGKSDFTNYSIKDAENAIDQDMWVIQIV